MLCPCCNFFHLHFCNFTIAHALDPPIPPSPHPRLSWSWLALFLPPTRTDGTSSASDLSCVQYRSTGVSTGGPPDTLLVSFSPARPLSRNLLPPPPPQTRPFPSTASEPPLSVLSPPSLLDDSC
ncbi:hypothetical protein BO70DRAFT_214582 [Aspergillus heteromorphus CBS 117.55]|uniref:Uncharacterized protein n=1 Tax=Aspergillus heteromorphus CBS 117.55 TaxID=1448321 RepID=A0A317WPC1_9EURO|nr:uncharacterized protein BO70DRAFT_214582 [Aspergillus heteromorphus CBS 117.55]PWY86957.1 hypothetical protein BO70DRAFT_214582 [Aspergillus heteromorphus CBS 117.55]